MSILGTLSGHFKHSLLISSNWTLSGTQQLLDLKDWMRWLAPTARNSWTGRQSQYSTKVYSSHTQMMEAQKKIYVSRVVIHINYRLKMRQHKFWRLSKCASLELQTSEQCLGQPETTVCLLNLIREGDVEWRHWWGSELVEGNDVHRFQQGRPSSTQERTSHWQQNLQPLQWLSQC